MDVEFRHRELFAFACEAYSRVILQEDRKSRMARCSSSHGRTSGGKGWVDSSAPPLGMSAHGRVLRSRSKRVGTENSPFHKIPIRLYGISPNGGNTDCATQAQLGSGFGT